MTAAKSSRPPARAALVKTVAAALDDMKAVNVKVLDVRPVTDVSDCMVLASGNSDRHVRSIADRVVERAKAAGFRPIGVEGERDGEWVLVDLNDVIVHVMLPRVREFYGL
ncbi:MAG TPA: ribosome silencing factor, partial [Steroidobacteraceae bacterium]|nr:ribosome silencing factor [Steroidobacteraceae bacterium]